MFDYLDGMRGLDWIDVKDPNVDPPPPIAISSHVKDRLKLIIARSGKVLQAGTLHWYYSPRLSKA